MIEKLQAQIQGLVSMTDERTTPTTFVRDGVLYVSTEDGNHFADYYGEYRGGAPWIDSRIEAAARDHGYFWEWQNAACIGAYRI